MICSLFFIFFLYHKCKHHGLLKKVGGELKFQHPSQQRVNLKADNPQPIRVTTEMRFLTNTWTQKNICTRVNQSITNLDNEKYSCKQEDILTTGKLQVFNETFQNVIKYLRSHVNVTIPQADPIPVESVEGLYDIPVKNLEQRNSDFHVTFAQLPGLEYTIAAASAISLTLVDYRPISGFVLLNPAYIPSTSSNYNSFNKEYFCVILHELMHALGFSEDLFPYWLDPSTNKPYDNKLPIGDYTLNGKVFRILSTPYLQKWVQLRFNITRFSSTVPAGLELELEGGEGTAGSHPEQTKYFGDFMAGVSTGLQDITELTFIALLDSGWYKIDFRGAKRLLFGWGPSFGQPPLEKFPTGPPQIDWPSHYICITQKTVENLTWDYHALGYCRCYTIDCTKYPDYYFCKYSDFYDPLKTGCLPYDEVYGAQIPYPYSDRNCLDPDNFQLETTDRVYPYHIPGTNSFIYNYSYYSGRTLYQDALCLETTCNEDGKTTTVKGKLNQTAICNYNGELFNFTNTFQVRCSNPVHICNQIKYDKYFNTPDVFAYENWDYSHITPIPTPTPQFPIKIGIDHIYQNYDDGAITFYFNQVNKGTNINVVNLTQISRIYLQKEKDWYSPSFTFNFDAGLYDLIIRGTLEVSSFEDSNLYVRFNGSQLINNVNLGIINEKGTVSVGGKLQDSIIDISLNLTKISVNSSILILHDTHPSQYSFFQYYLIFEKSSLYFKLSLCCIIGLIFAIYFYLKFRGQTKMEKVTDEADIQPFHDIQ